MIPTVSGDRSNRRFIEIGVLMNNIYPRLKSYTRFSKRGYFTCANVCQSVTTSAKQCQNLIIYSQTAIQNTKRARLLQSDTLCIIILKLQIPAPAYAVSPQDHSRVIGVRFLLICRQRQPPLPNQLHTIHNTGSLLL